MKKILILFVFILTLIALCACNTTPCDHPDTDGNLICDSCGADLSDGHIHLPIEQAEDKYLAAEGDCENAATYYHSCACGYIYDTTFSYGGAVHVPLPDAVEENRQEPTCTESGSYDSVKYCALCGDEASRESIPIPPAHTYVGTACTACDIQYIRDGEYIYFGEYPQTLARNITVTNKKPDSRGYFLANDGAYYAKVVATPYDSGYAFSAGVEVKDGSTYYFKVEPIRWRILSESDGTALIICDSIIDHAAYDSVSNDYKESDVRAWLNSEFYNTAFSELQSRIILTTTVDNSATSTGASNNSNACENTNDKIFLPSYSDVVNTAYGFSANADDKDAARGVLASDYSRAMGVRIPFKSSESPYYGNGCWWLRSPSGSSTKDARYVFGDGFIGTGFTASASEFGVIPMIRIMLDHRPGEAVEENRTEATCVSAGSYDRVVYCLECEDEISRETVIIPASHEYVGTACTKCQKQYIREGDFIYFGEFPQSIKADSVTVSATQDSRGYFLGSDGSYYAKVVAAPFESGYVFSSGATVTAEETYYFKVEPIRWRILAEDNGKALILCDSIIERAAYDSASNDYKESDARAWLNAEFYNTAFSELQRAIISLTTVDNSAGTTCSPSNQYVCESTEDNVFLISYKDALNTAYGFTATTDADASRGIKTSDYSRAAGVQITQKNQAKDDYGCGSWWLRSPSDSYTTSASYVYGNGYVSSALNVTTAKLGVVPAMWITL